MTVPKARVLPFLPFFVVAVLCLVLESVEADTTLNFSLSYRGGLSLTTVGGASSVAVGYARIQPSGGGTIPSGLAIFGIRRGGVLVSEAGVSASGLIRAGRIYAEVSGPVDTGIAIANPNAQAA